MVTWDYEPLLRLGNLYDKASLYSPAFSTLDEFVRRAENMSQDLTVIRQGSQASASGARTCARRRRTLVEAADEDGTLFGRRDASQGR